MAKITTSSDLFTAEGTHLAHAGDGVLVPERVTIHYEDDDDLPYTVDLEVVVRAGRLVCETLTLHAIDDGPPVTTDALRRVPVAGIVRAGLVGHVLERDPDNPQSYTPFSPDADIAKHGPTDEALRAAATIYRLAYALGDSPTKAVATALELTHSTAARWVATARERGFLASTTQGRAGGVLADETEA